jgi:MFS family permease
MAKYTEVLRNRNFFFLWLGQVISQFGDRLNQMALIALIYQRAPGSSWELAKLLSFTIIPVFLIGPVAGAYVDRWDRRRTMILCDILRGILVLLIPLSLFHLKPIFPVYLVVLCVFSITRFYLPAKLAIIPDLVSQDKLLLANSLATTTGMIAAIVSFGIGGILVAAIGAKVGFYIDSLSYFLSALLILGIRSELKRTQEIQSKIKLALEVIKKSTPLEISKYYKKTKFLTGSIFREVKEGLKYLIKMKEIRFVVNALFWLWSALGAIYVVIIVFVQQTLQSVTRDLGLLVVFLGCGLFFGSLAYGRLGERFSRIKTISTCLSLSGLVVCLFAVLTRAFPSFWVAGGLSLLLGLVISPIMVSSNTLVHEVIHNQMRGRVFGTLEIVVHAAFLLFMLITASLAEYISRLWILVGVGAIFAIRGVLGLYLLRERSSRLDFLRHSL